LGCDSDENSQPGEGFTGDVGVECEGLCQEEGWCYDGDLATCVSFMCVGPSAGESYCTQACENDGMCPENYRCTVDCEVFSDQPYCVKKGDYEQLFLSGRCQAP